MILAGDLGGTKTILAEFEKTGEGLHQIRSRTFSSHSYPTFDGILIEYLKDRTGPEIEAACFGVAGTVVNGGCKLTNLPWSLEEFSLSKIADAPRVKLLNDLETTAFGMLSLSPSDLEVIQAGDPGNPGRAGNIAVIAAGTGLGEAMLYWDANKYHPIASEGGHADFSPRTDREVELWKYLHKRYAGHVSYERVLSGPGFLNIYEFLRDTCGLEEPPWLNQALKAANVNAVISQHGLAGDVPLCVETVEIFASIYGAEAGNAALRCVSIGGVFVGGGIAPKLLPALKSRHFLDSFRDKGRFASFMDGIEISVALNPDTALLGAAHYALRLVA